MDYSGHDSHAGDHSQQQQHTYDAPSHHHQHHSHPSQQTQQTQQHPRQQHRSSIHQHHPGLPTPSLSEHGEPHQASSQPQHPNMSQHQHHASQMLMDPSQMGDHRLGQSGFGGPGSVVAPLYSTMPSTTQAPHSQHAPNRLKRPRLDELDISVATMSPMDQQGLDSIHNTPIAGPYSQASSAVQHHHHHLPDSGPPSKLARREDGGGGAPSVVGQAGMPQPAARPRGPKLKFTPEDDQLLIDLKEHKNLTWKQIADFFPGRTSGTLQVRYCTKLKAKTTLWTDETVS